MRKALLIILLSGFVVTGCAIRRAPPVRYVPLLGAKKDTSMEAVLERALEDKNPIVRLDAVRLLGTMTDPELQERAASALGRALKDPDENTRFEAVKSLSNFSADIAGPYLMKRWMTTAFGYGSRLSRCCDSFTSRRPARFRR